MPDLERQVIQEAQRESGREVIDVCANLIDNASKYSDNGSNLHITFSTRRGEAGAGKASAIVSVRDQGIGISPDILPRLFTLFSQACPSLARAGSA